MTEVVVETDFILIRDNRWNLPIMSISRTQ